jgi:hypothetical protein
MIHAEKARVILIERSTGLIRGKKRALKALFLITTKRSMSPDEGKPKER